MIVLLSSIISLTLSTLSSSEWQELCKVTSATWPACDTISTFIAWDTCRPVSTAVFSTSQFWLQNINEISIKIENFQINCYFYYGIQILNFKYFIWLVAVSCLIVLALVFINCQLEYRINKRKAVNKFT